MDRVRYLNGSRWADLGPATDTRWLRVMLAIALLVCGGCAGATEFWKYLPDHEITPGEANPVLTQKKLCSADFRTGPFRKVTVSLKNKVFQVYGISCIHGNRGRRAGLPKCAQYEVDHLISLELGGANTLANLWPEPYSGQWNAHIKDALENRLHKAVCAGELTLAEAQDEISTDWIASYKKWIGNK